MWDWTPMLRSKLLCCLVVLWVAGSASADGRRSSTKAVGRTDSSQSLEDQSVLEFLGVGQDRATTDAERVAKYLNDRHRVAAFLQRRKIKATDEAVTRQLERVERVLARNGKTLDEALSAMGVTQEQLEMVLSVPVAWKIYLQTIVTEEMISEEFLKHRSRYDGTVVEIAQIVLSKERSELDAKKLLARLTEKELQFADAAKSHSIAASKSNSGVVGPVRFRGDVPNAVADWAFMAEPGQLSSPVETPYGWHIVKVISRRAGSRSLEDARLEVIGAISDRLWREAVESEDE